MCLAAMFAASLSTKAQEITITLNSGWNWISYPNAEVMDVASALGDFVPANGDRLKLRDASANYVNGRWRGRVTHFIPGLGYMYYSMRTEPVTFVFARVSSPQVPVLTTMDPTDITPVSAVVGGTVTVPIGCRVIQHGVCWDTEPNSNLFNGNHNSKVTDIEIGSFNDTLVGLTPNTTYYVRAFVVSIQSDGSSDIEYGNVKIFTTMSGIPEVNTAEVASITATGATCGGTVTTDGGLTITVRGVCWSTSSNPTIADSHSTDGTGTGSFNSTLTSLTPNTTYYVRAYATNSHVTVYGNQRSFTTEAGGSGGDHAYVDLGLPSGLLWATCNVGADAPEEYGDYFAWGETQPKDTYNWSTYQYCNGTYNTLTKYCNNSSYSYNGFTDNLTTLLPEDDAATANWGSDWRMPTQAEFQELLDNTTVTWTTLNGVNGHFFTASNGNSLFLPAAGYYYNSGFNSTGSYGFYWSSSLYTNIPYRAWFFNFYSDGYYMSNYRRYYGQSVRPVRSSGRH